MVGDIFGFSTQVLQGADRLASNKYLVFYPDFFDGEPAKGAWWAPTSEDGPAKIKAFFATLAGKNSPATALGRIPAFIAEVTKEKKTIETWGGFGLCWGGKVVSIGGDNLGMKVSVQVHPAMLDASDALKITIPFALLASKDEDAAEVEKFGANLKGEKLVETFNDLGHGWMGARGNLEEEKGREGFTEGYKWVADFFEKYL